MFNFDKVVNRENTGSVKWDLRKEIFGTDEVLPMWVADMDFETPDFIVNAVKERANHPIYGYSFMQNQYFESFINWVKRRHGWDIEKGWLVFSPGIVTALNAAVIAFTELNQGVIIQPPVYEPFFSSINNNNRKLIINQLNNIDNSYVIDFDDLRTKAKDAKLIILSNPHNPVSKSFSKDELMEIANICLENDIIIVSDEIHCDLIHPQYKHIPMASLSEEIANITITCMAPSKTFNVAGFFTSSVIIKNENLRKRFKMVMESMHLTYGNIFGLVASEAAYMHGDEYVDELNNYISDNFNLIDNFLIKEIPKLHLSNYNATYLAWLDFRDLNLTDKELNIKMIQNAKLGLSAGTIFGNAGSGFMRMNLGTSKKVISQALESLKNTFFIF